MAEAIRAFGGDPEALATATARDAAELLGYCEVHIEQGPVLEAEDLRVGVVSGIAGQTRAAVAFRGLAGHAGTVPMPLRRDALAAAAEWVLAVESVARETDGLVATVGQATVEPGQPNVIPGAVRASLDVRHAEDAVREAACARLREHARAVAASRGLTVDWEPVQDTPAVACSPTLTDAWAAACEETGQPIRRLLSGAGHDAAMMAAIAPVAMLFVRCAGGVSHNPAEAVDAGDVAAAIDVTTRFLVRLGPPAPV
jgi:hydantoinase/carbamoylase family amidase